MIPKFPIIELLDRLVIAQIKYEKTKLNGDELEFYLAQAQQLDLTQVSDLLEQLKTVHLQIWNLEFLLKSGQEQQLSLEEIGRRAIEIRNHNNQRIRLKNHMAKMLGDSIREIKKDHISE